MTDPRIRITIDGRLALTTEQAADRLGMQPSTVRAAISRLQLEPDAQLDSRRPLYLATRLLDALKARPGRGANLRRAED